MRRTIVSMLSLVVLGESFLVAEVPREARLQLPELARHPGYKVDEHVVTTDDGYLIRIHRMRRSSVAGTKQQTIPIILMHGIFACSEDFVRIGPGSSLAFLLADEGYDVWLANLRGNIYSTHKTLKRSDSKFWDYSLDELGKYDVPNTVEKVLELTNSSQVHYLGYSMGTTSYLIACNKRPDVMSSVATFVGMAPVFTLGPRIVAIIHWMNQLRIVDLLTYLLPDVVLGDVNQIQLFATMMCNANNRHNEICFKMIHFFTGEDYDHVAWDKLKIVAMKVQPSTIRQLLHYNQLGLTGQLSEYDWGEKENLIRYGRATPQAYELAANTAPTALFYGANDFLSAPMGKSRLSRKLKSRKNMFFMENVLPENVMNHLDFVYSKDVKCLLNDRIIDMIPKLMKHVEKDKKI